MLNLVEKFTPEAVAVSDEDGVVAIEYVMLAAGVVTVAALVVTTLTGTGGLGTKLTAILARII